MTSAAADGVQHGGRLVEHDALRAAWPARPRWRSAASVRRRAGAARALRIFVHADGPAARRPPAAGSPPAARRGSPGAKATSSSTTLATIWLSGFWNTMPTRAGGSRAAASRPWCPCRRRSTLPPAGQQHGVEGAWRAWICRSRCGPGWRRSSRCSMARRHAVKHERRLLVFLARGIGIGQMLSVCSMVDMIFLPLLIHCTSVPVAPQGSASPVSVTGRPSSSARHPAAVPSRQRAAAAYSQAPRAQGPWCRN